MTTTDAPPPRLDALPDVMNVAEVAAVLRVTPETVYRMIRRGDLPCWGGSRKTRVTKRQLMRMLEGDVA